MTGRLRVRDQHIAVFGGSGSGKTVLVSSFYGATQEQVFLQNSLFHITADDTGQGNRLRQNYLGMKNQAKVPEPTRFSSTPYRFTLQSKGQANQKVARSQPFDAVRLVWHDYPGEWFEEEPSSAEEATRRVDTFRSLMRSDVALILVDGQKLIDHADEPYKYLKSLIWGIREGLLRLKHDLLDDGKPLVHFPRIWIVALSKADLHPDLTAHAFQDLVIENAAGDLADLAEVIRGFVQMPEAVSVGDDFMLLSSAKFTPERIEVAERVGIDLILPVAVILPLDRAVAWYRHSEIPRKWLDRIADNSTAFAPVIAGAARFLRAVPYVGPALAAVGPPAILAAMDLGVPQLKELNARARATQNYLTAILTQFQLDLDQGIQDDLLVKRQG